MKRLSFTLFILLLINILPAQELPEAYRAFRQKYPEGPPLNHWDSIYLMNIPEKHFPLELRSDPLPPVVDNSEWPYLRPVFTQGGASCGQAAMIGYNFTYEMDYHRNLPADVPENQYPTHFAWNFENGGNGWFGVSYFHSLELLRLCGTMNVEDYGGMENDGLQWITGYDKYYNGMHNRIRGFYSIHTGTAEGILALKHWLFNHMGEGTAGGVASFYANVPWNAVQLNDTTPEGGKDVMTWWYPAATHAMTIVGYNDSIRWDYNDDGQYTNDIDLNYDGNIDPRDWEIGGVKFVNSYGVDANDSGFCYMMYKCLAETFEYGGVWNRSVNILDIDEDYEPLVTYKVTLKHDRRGLIKVMVGISNDTTSTRPDFIMDFPMFNYQGDGHYLQGIDTAESMKYLEFGLDVTPLLSYLEPGQPGKFFLIVVENDPKYEGSGELIGFSLIDYTSAETEWPASGLPAGLNNNDRTMATVVQAIDFDKVEVATELLPAFQPGIPYSVQLEAQGGSIPYSWDLRYSYVIEESSGDFPQISDEQIMPNIQEDTLVAIPLGFDFPFYGKVYDTVYVHVDGHLQFDQMQLPWPYVEDYDLHLRSNRIITPMTHDYFSILEADGDGVWCEITGDTALFRWKLSWSENPYSTDFNFALMISSDGKINFIYGPSTLEDYRWIGGISAGNKRDYLESPVSDDIFVQEGKTITYIPQPFPRGLDISENGLLTFLPETDSTIYDIFARVRDANNLTATRTLQISSGPQVFFTIHAGDDERIDFGDTVILDMEVLNNGPDTLHNIFIYLNETDPYTEMLNGISNVGDLLPGASYAVDSAFEFIISLNVPDQHAIFMDMVLTSSEGNWYKSLDLIAYAPRLEITDLIINDGNNGLLDPGETSPADMVLFNSGHAPVEGVEGFLFSLDEEVLVTGNPAQSFGTIGIGASVTRTFELYAQETAPNGYPAQLVLNLASTSGIQMADSIILRVGRIPVLIVDMDPNMHSGPIIAGEMNQLGIIADYYDHIPETINDYQSVFICLGYHFSNHVLTWEEGHTLEHYLEDYDGRIYMEGKKTWKDDPATPVHDNFNLSWAGTATVFDTLVGYDTTFTKNLRLYNAAQYPFSFYWLEPIPPAFNILQDNNLLKSCAVAYDAGNYRTIGTLFEFGTLADLPPSYRIDLLKEYLLFFGIDINATGVVDDYSYDEKLEICVYPNPASRQLAVSSQQSAVSSQQSFKLNITDLYGRKIQDYGNVSFFPFLIDISGLNSGLYLLQMISDDGHSASAKFLKISE